MQSLNKLKEKVAQEGLHVAVGKRLQQEGYKVASVGDLPTAIRVLGTKIYEKNAEYRRIIEGLQSLRQLERS